MKCKRISLVGFISTVAMGGCYSVVMATKLKMFRRGGHGAATVLPVTSNDDGPCCSLMNHDHDSITGK